MHIAQIRCWIFWIPFNSRVGFWIRKTSRCCLWRLSRHGNTHVVMWKLEPFFFETLQSTQTHNEPQKKERMQILLHRLDNVWEKCLRKHEWLYSVRTFENYTITIVRFEWVFRQIVKSSMISSAFSVLEEACLPYIFVANCTILSHYGLHVVSPHFVSDKMIKW